MYAWYKTKVIPAKDDAEKEEVRKRIGVIAKALVQKVLEAPAIYCVYSKITGEPALFSQTVDRQDGTYMCKKMKKNIVITPELEEYIKTSNAMYMNSLNNQFDLFEQAIKGKKKSEYNDIIKEFRGKIITTASEQVSKDFALLVSQCSE